MKLISKCPNKCKGKYVLSVPKYNTYSMEDNYYINVCTKCNKEIKDEGLLKE